MATVVLMAMGAGCAPRRAPESRPAPPARIEAHLTATPPLTIAGHLVTLHGWLDDPTAAVKCPTVTWTWPNGLRSSHTSDCDPDEQVFRHSDTKQGALPAGEHEFKVTFDSRATSGARPRRWKSIEPLHGAIPPGPPRGVVALEPTAEHAPHRRRAPLPRRVGRPGEEARMKPVTFPGADVVFAKDQPEYLQLPARRAADGLVTTCWALSWRERLAVLIRGRFYLDVLTFNQPLQPLRPHASEED